MDDAPIQTPQSARAEVIDATGRLATPAVEWLCARAGEALGVLGARGEVRVRVVADLEMAEAHMEFCEVEGTTDVLTFDMSPPVEGEVRELDVDILACLDEAERQGAARGHAPERELLLYVVHGLLHCLGYDDHDPELARAMHAAEDRVLAEIGVGTTYAAPERPEGGR